MILVDSDSLLYRAGFVANEEGQEALAKWQLDEIIKGLYATFPGNDFKFYISGSDNFRYSIYPEYKGNRADTKRPTHLGALREHIVREYGANVSDGIEADDQVSIDAYGQDVVIAHIDKDLDLIPGCHYNYTKNIEYDVDELGAHRNFYKQLIMGDKADNIPGYDGKMRPKVPKFLLPAMEDLLDCACPEAMLDIVAGYYQEDWKRLDLSARCLWLLRSEGDDWTKWLNENTMEELGRKADLTALLQARSAPQVDDGPQSSSV